MPGTWQASSVWALLTACLCLQCWWSASGWGPCPRVTPPLCVPSALWQPSGDPNWGCGSSRDQGATCPGYHWGMAAVGGRPPAQGFRVTGNGPVSSVGVEIVISELLVVGKEVLRGRGWVLSSLFPLPPGFIGCPLCPPRQLKTRT